VPVDDDPSPGAADDFRRLTVSRRFSPFIEPFIPIFFRFSRFIKKKDFCE
jgi:hypothetical protein